ncbi:MAG: sensor histidine kinase [Candidatus Hodarchaeales archaeon]
MKLYKNPSDINYHQLFHGSSIPQLLEDFSEAKKYLDSILKDKKPQTIRQLLENDINELVKIIRLVKIVDVNTQALALYGARDKSEIPTLDTIIGDESYDVFKEEIIALYGGQQVFKTEIINYALTGERLHLLVQVGVMAGYSDLNRVHVSIIDISDQKQTKMALEISEKKYRLLFESVPVAIGIATFPGELIEYNNELLKVLGITRKEAKKLNIKDLYVNRSDRDDIFAVIKKKGKIKNKRILIRNKNGRVFPILTNMHYSQLMGQDVVFSAFVDHTELENYRKKLEKLVEERTERLEQKNNELEEFVYTISHDLKSPLLSIAGFSYLIQTKIKDELDDELETYFGSIQRNVKRIESIINDILEYSRIGRVEEKRELYDLNKILEEVVTSFKPRLKTSSINLEIVAKMPEVYVVKKRIVQVFENLIDNAIKFMDFDKKERKIEIGVLKETSDDYVVVYVRDSGVGIREEDLPKIFRLFSRIPNPKTNEVSGSGVGLANVKKIMENHGGNVWVESKEGVGSNFYLQIPLK